MMLRGQTPVPPGSVPGFLEQGSVPGFLEWGSVPGFLCLFLKKANHLAIFIQADAVGGRFPR